ncbi:MAG: peptidoglycan-binding protein, partial [Actinomycetota bacterium]|nr:peptidoglycan-binding protein [Actinomycetota bacterium]
VTYRHNRVYGRPIFPLGQIYEHPPASQIRRFRALAAARGATGVSWWSWQSGSARSFRAVAAPFNRLRPPPDDGWPTLGRRSRGDLVVWAQQHLLSAGKPLRVTGTMTPATRAAISAFQAERGLAATGNVDSRTWPALRAYGAAPVKWRRRGYAVAAGRKERSSIVDRASTAPMPSVERPEPLSSRLPARRNELLNRAGR